MYDGVPMRNDGPRLGLLGPSRRADGCYPRLVGRCVLTRDRFSFNPLPEHFRETPVDDLYLAERAHHDVRGFEIAVDDPRE